MAERRKGPFPAPGDVVTADDGSTWAYTWLGTAVEGNHVTQNYGWEQLEPSPSVDELAERKAERRHVLQRLELALRIWELAAAACPLVKVEGASMRRNDPLPMFVELLSRTVLTDCIAETCDGHPLGLAEHIARQLSGLLGPGTAQRVASMMQRHVLTARTRQLAR